MILSMNEKLGEKEENNKNQSNDHKMCSNVYRNGEAKNKSNQIIYYHSKLRRP